MENRRQAYFRSDFRVREETEGEVILEGYFIVYNQKIELWRGFTEEIMLGACTESLRSGENIMALFNHNRDLVIGSTQGRSLELIEDFAGVYGRVAINREDSDAMNVYQRVKRGDVQGCSFGFSIESEKYTNHDDGSVACQIEKVKIYEVSICPFPAYPTTSIQARKEEWEGQERRRLEEIRQIEERKAGLWRRLNAKNT